MSTFAAPARVLVRGVSTSFPECLRSDRGVRIDVEAARRQHASYVAVLRDLGIAVDEVPPDPACPDCCFIEDTAVVVTAKRAILTCPGAPARRAEVEPVAAALAGAFSIDRMTQPATLDGGDVLRCASHLFVGLSTRTNRAGLEALAAAAEGEGLSVVPVDVRGGLHLKSACTLAGPSLVVYDATILDDAALSSLRAAGLRTLAAHEPAGANVLALGETVLVSAAAPRTAASLAKAGISVRVVDVSEMHKADGALTCLSLRVPPPRAWCT